MYHLKKRSIARKSQLWWYERGNSGGSWLPEDKKANMWPERGNSGGSLPPAFPRSSGSKSGLVLEKRTLRNISQETFINQVFVFLRVVFFICVFIQLKKNAKTRVFSSYWFRIGLFFCLTCLTGNLLILF